MDRSVDDVVRDLLVAALGAFATRTRALSFADMQIVDFGHPSGALMAHLESVPMAEWHVTVGARVVDELPEARVAIRRLAGEPKFRGATVVDTDGKPREATREERRTAARDALLRLVTAYVQRTGSFDFQEDQATALLRDFRHVWLSPTVRHTVIVPLLSLDMGVEAIGFDDVLMLVRLSADMKRALYRPPTVFVDKPLTARDLASAGGALFATYESVALRDSWGGQPIWVRVERALEALRLLRAGTVCPGVWFDCVIPADLSDGSSEQHIGDWRPNAFGRTPYQLRSDDVSGLRELYEALTTIEARSDPHGLEEPLREFKRTYGQLYVEERIKALGTVFETALMADRPRVKGGGKSEVFAPRGARLVAATYDEAASTVVMQTCYRVRNRLTHQGKTLHECAAILADAGMSAEELVTRAFELARAVLAAFVLRLASNGAATAASIAAELGRQIGM